MQDQPPPAFPETREVRLKRLRLRSIRRGIREMDLILGAVSETLDSFGDPELDAYEALLDENDHDLYAWITAQAAPPDRHADLISRIARGLAESPPPYR